MVESSGALLRYLACNVDSNKIGDRGCKYLAKGRWNILTILTLGTTSLTIESNKINDKGIKNLAKAWWKHLSRVNLSSSCGYKDFNNVGNRGC